MDADKEAFYPRHPRYPRFQIFSAKEERKE